MSTPFDNASAEPPTDPETSLGRRELLKALAASSGAVAAATLLPGEWVTPAVETGLLPVHAQASPTATPIPTATLAPPRPAITSCGGVSNFLGSTTQVLFDDDERIVDLFARVSPIPPVGTLVRFDVTVNGSPVAIDDTPPTLPVVATDATGLADFNLTTPFSITVRPVVASGAGFDELNLGDIVSITFTFEPPVDPSLDPIACVANFTVIPQ